MLFCFFSYGYCTLIGNPAQPALQNAGLLRECPDWWSFRASYYGDFVYNQQFREEFVIDETVQSSSDVKLWTQAGMLTFNIRSRIDLYGILGGMRLKIDDEVLTKQHFAWGVGGKVIIFHEGRFRLGCDFKYFQSDQKPHFFQSEDLAYNTTDNFYFDYHEMQAALGISYRRKYLSPYVNASYLVSKLNPRLPKVGVRLPMMNVEVDVIARSVTASNHWGLCVGATIIDQSKATIAIEWRAFNQNSIDICGEFRF
ncbi:MAG TPA: hypothetical protein VLE96_04710 [Chlamydiales bacterium]|nr:hypothetical protein [Chlamydiales bacterium]